MRDGGRHHAGVGTSCAFAQQAANHADATATATTQQTPGGAAQEFQRFPLPRVSNAPPPSCLTSDVFSSSNSASGGATILSRSEQRPTLNSEQELAHTSSVCTVQ